jgi:predicted DNA-binding protein (MmcQ/YjbR family)
VNIEAYREYCIAKPGVTEGTPFGPSVLVFKVMNKMFALCDIDQYSYVNLKCDPERAIQLREQFPGITPGYHMNKQQWNSVSTDGSIPDDLFKELIDHSYELVAAGLKKADREALKNLQ